MLEGAREMTTKKEILVRLDITGATDTKCHDGKTLQCITALECGCPFGMPGPFARPELSRHPSCIAAEKADRESEGTK